MPDPTRPPPDDRASRILAHYFREVALGHMAPEAAACRALEDIAGQNHHPTKPQRPAAQPSSQEEEKGTNPK